MINKFKFKNLEKKDINKILPIYNYHIKNGLNNFEEKPLNLKIFTKLCTNIIDNNLPFLLCLDKNKILGFCYISKFRYKSGYRFTFENSVYVHHKYMNIGLGNKLLRELIKNCSDNNKIKTIIAVINNTSKASVKIHKKNGFKTIGTLKKVGYKKKNG